MRRIGKCLGALGRPGRRDRGDRQALIVCGLGYASYRLLARIAASRRYTAVAVIDDEPWNHGTEVEGVRVHYPSEAASLARRHGVVAVVHDEPATLAMFDGATRAALGEAGVPVVRLSGAAPESLETQLRAARGH
ncbi:MULTISPECIES: hypothetical protein [unclassified Modicisalibacter]|uniref:nucleoside-diphosphate sugar epimerase/dehydratase n=1 Tax=unclassified Modicisalibacter TaxID=2679913 RepID=UPI001CCE0819|nr:MULTISPECIES: hypothetical protein [unclassified Modicisalibacter]MBZ9560373.1 hypothetical protein [Modicisalibacter sp. R2A 31.J]MBZ9576282.1 hypothetical protein [Modicisalibacter sp. MOD 31.J]